MRQSSVSFDAAGSLTHGHYVLQLHDGLAGSGAPPGSGGAVSSSGGGEGSVFATDSLWFPPPGNVLPAVFNDTLLLDGLRHLLKRTAAPGGGGAAAGGAAGSGAVDSSGAVDTSSGGSGGGSRGRLTLDFVVGSTNAWQQRHVRAYVDSDMGGDASWRRRTLLVLSLCIWEGRDVRPA